MLVPTGCQRSACGIETTDSLPLPPPLAVDQPLISHCGSVMWGDLIRIHVVARHGVTDLPSLWLWLLALVTCLVAAVTDWRQGRIPNRLTYSAMGLGILLQTLLPRVIDLEDSVRAMGATQSLLGLAVGFGAMLVVALISRGGGGDVKLAGALGAILGPASVVRVLGATCIAAVTGTCLILILTGGTSRVFRRLTLSRTLTASSSDTHNPPAEADESRSPLRSTKVPLGPYFLLGVLLVAWSEMDYR